MHARRRHGFTLIELLVVVAIIGLLLSILLPSLSKAREQGRIAVCLSNMRSIAQAASSYYIDEGDMLFAVPFGGFAGHSGWNIITELVWGGGVPDRTRRQYNQVRDLFGAANPLQSDVYFIPPEDRPLNKYLYPDWSEATRVKGNPERFQVAYKPPGTFQCPSDSHAFVPMAGAGGDQTDIETDTIFKSWVWWGTSYAINWYWPYYYMQAPPGDAPPYNGSFTRIIGGDRRTPGLGSVLLREKEAKGASEFVLFYEEAMNYMMEAAAPRGAPGLFNQERRFGKPGWHKQIDHYTAAFFDGHAAYRKFDTRYTDGPGWTTWPNRPWQGHWAQYSDN